MTLDAHLSAAWNEGEPSHLIVLSPFNKAGGSDFSRGGATAGGGAEKNGDSRLIR